MSPACSVSPQTLRRWLVATVDGPVGVGKSVMAEKLALALGWRAMDTGAMYRALAWKALRDGFLLNDEEKLAKLLVSMDLQVSGAGRDQRVLVDGEDVTLAIRTPEISVATPVVARHPKVRAAMVERQRMFAGQGELVAEGRDMGTVVFPQAAAKFYLTASYGERFARRRRQMLEQGQTVASDEELMGQLRERDELDRRRAASALRVAPDSYVIDSTELTEGKVLEMMIQLVHSAMVEANA